MGVVDRADVVTTAVVVLRIKQTVRIVAIAVGLIEAVVAASAKQRNRSLRLAPKAHIKKKGTAT